VLAFNAVWRLNQLFNFFLRSTRRTRRASSIHKSGNTGNTGYETDREDNNVDLGNNRLAVPPSSEVIFESDGFDDESSPEDKGEKEKEKKKVELDTESDDEKSFIEEEIEKVG
jgi:hypothetical protein